MVKFIRNLFLYWRYRFAFYRCDKLNENRKKDLCIVINLGNSQRLSIALASFVPATKDCLSVQQSGKIYTKNV